MEGKKCKVEIFSRVTGFFRPVQTWNKGKVEEYNERRKYRMESVRKKIKAS
ncbi:MAG: anaerobic ribonucleoside-triphosphate reductase [Candidatus Omnitrophica bacterium]|nr:anaerobic ribonucleoside-triphosphate reductase [Candidatus Omnitrophota bacterium]